MSTRDGHCIYFLIRANLANIFFSHANIFLNNLFFLWVIEISLLFDILIIRFSFLFYILFTRIIKIRGLFFTGTLICWTFYQLLFLRIILIGFVIIVKLSIENQHVNRFIFFLNLFFYQFNILIFHS
jgi:hypothetical protein